MKKLLIRGLAALSLLLAAGTTKAQAPGQLPAVPEDPEVRIGHLDNGLTYYIRHNNNPKGQADFYIAQKVGSVLEEDNQRGLAHFLEHMCFNGTQNFPGKGIIDYLASIGVKFGYNLNAYTSFDETVYNISNVPVARTSVQDSCLLILHDWACALSLEPAEIDAERGVIHEEWRQGNAGSMRIMEQLAPKMYDGNRYGERLPIGTMEVVDNFPHQALIDYYHTWYRPDQQAIIVVGDIEPDYIEAKIKETFAHIKMPENAKERVYFDVEDTDGTIYAIGSDKEMQFPAVLLMYKNDNLVLPRSYRRTAAYYPMHYISTMVASMLNTRLDDLSKKPDCEYANAGIELGGFMFSADKGALTLQVIAKDNDVVPALTQAYREILRAARTGFTVGEYERARAEFMSRIEKAYEERNDKKNEQYSKEYVQHFVNGLPAPGIAYVKEQYDSFVNLIGVDAINQLLPQVITEDADNRVLLAMLPEKEGFTAPTEQQFADALESVDNEELEGYKDEMRTDPLIPALPAPGKVKSTRKLAEWDATEYTLSNGVKVIVKPTDFKNNEIVLDAVAKGKGLSEIDAALAASAKYAPVALSTYGIHNYNSSDIQKYTQGKQAGVSFSSSEYSREFEGHSTSKDLPTLMELIYGYFTGLNIDEQEFEATRGSVIGMLANQENTPNYLFSRKLTESLYASPVIQTLTTDDIKAAKRDEIVKAVRAMLQNAADYTFVFTGSIDETTFVPLMEQYIATLPTDTKNLVKDVIANPAFEVKAGTGTDRYTSKMETPQTYAFVGFFAEMPYTAKNRLLASVSAQILSKRLLNKVREEMGATYSISASGQMSRLGKLNTTFQTAFPMKPEMKDEVLAAIKELTTTMKENVTEAELKPVVEFMVKQTGEDLKDNSSWAGAMAASTLNGVTTFINNNEILGAITVTDVQKFISDVLAQNNYRVIVLDPDGDVQEAAK